MQKQNKKLSRQLSHASRLVFVGDVETLRNFCQKQLGKGTSMPPVDCFATAGEAVEAMLRQPADLVLSTLYTLSAQDAKALTVYCADSATQLFALPAHVSKVWQNVELVSVADGWMLTQRSLAFDHCASRLWRRLIDVFIALVLLLTLFPLFYVFVAVSVKRFGAGSVLLRKDRRDCKGNKFGAWYFRTHHHTSKEPLRVGAFLQRTHFNELPQLLNVFVGQMSLVGPQLHQLHLEDWDASALACFLNRHQVKAGMTGWARVHREATPSLEYKRQKEMDFVREWTPWTDFVVLWRTLLVMLLR